MRLLVVTAFYTALIIVVVAFIMRGLAMLIPGTTVTSWYRTPMHNDEVGGMVGSAHLIGWAVDLVPVTPAIEARARELFPTVVNEGNHLHAAVFKA